MINTLPKSLIEEARRILLESPQSSKEIIPMKSKSLKATDILSRILPQQTKPSIEDSKTNREDSLWKSLHDLHGSSMLLDTTDKDKLSFDHLFYRHRATEIDPIGWEYGIKEKVRNGSVNSVITQAHIVRRLNDTSRNYKKLSGDGFKKLKLRAINKINELGLVGTKSHNVDFKEHHFISTSDPETKGYTLVTRIHPNGVVHLTTILDPTMVDERESHFKTLIESSVKYQLLEIV
jgi:hypothetical protein